MRLRQSPRIPNFDYRGPLIGHLVSVTRLRQRIFEDGDLASLCLASLEETVARHQAALWAYCVMPDHVHVLVEVPEESSLAAFAKHFKQVPGYRLTRILGVHAWQVSYYDHLLRKPEAVLDVSHYIWENPVRAGIVENRMDYLYSGPREFMQG